MIFVTVGGGAYYQFDRLIKKVDEISEKQGLDIVAQIGCGKYEPRYARYFRFTSMSDMINFYGNASLIIAHASGAPILYARDFNLPLIIVPRMKEYKEIFDNHQYITAKHCELFDMIEIVYQINDLKEAINVSLQKKRLWVPSFSRQVVIEHLREYTQTLKG